MRDNATKILVSITIWHENYAKDWQADEAFILNVFKCSLLKAQAIACSYNVLLADCESVRVRPHPISSNWSVSSAAFLDRWLQHASVFASIELVFGYTTKERPPV